MARAVLGEKKAEYLSYISAILMSILGFFVMAIVIFFMGGFKHPGPLEDVTPVNRYKKVLWVVSLLILILSTPPLITMMF